MSDQQTLFEIDKPVDKVETRKFNSDIEDDRYDKDYCIRAILTEKYLWDMRCWFKPREQYSKEEVERQILKWLKDSESGKWTSNCGGCLFCIRRLLEKGWLTLDEIVDLVLRNYNIEYADAIGSWFL